MNKSKRALLQLTLIILQVTKMTMTMTTTPIIVEMGPIYK